MISRFLCTRVIDHPLILRGRRNHAGERGSRGGERRPDQRDGRAATIVPTESGRASPAEAIRTARTVDDRLYKGFDASTPVIVERRLETVTTRFSPREKPDE